MSNVTTTIDYRGLSEKYRPAKITTLLIGEAPPPGRTKYFYKPTPLTLNRDDPSLPATIFYHYFTWLPDRKHKLDEYDYEALLLRLKWSGVFLIDICDEPIRVRNSKAGLQRIKDDIPNLRRKLRARGLVIADKRITFLRARRDYASLLKEHFPRSTHIDWKNFRVQPGNEERKQRREERKRQREREALLPKLKEPRYCDAMSKRMPGSFESGKRR
jgi:hypothetical protein